MTTLEDVAALICLVGSTVAIWLIGAWFVG